MMAEHWPKEKKIAALTLVAAVGITEASIQTGIPYKSLYRWASQQNEKDLPENENRETRKRENEKRELPPSKKIRDMAQDVVAQAKVCVAASLEERLKQVGERIADMIEAAVSEAMDVMRNGPNADEPKANWLRAIIGAIAQGVEKSQLLRGEPTVRTAIESKALSKNETLIKSIASDPESREMIDALFRRVESFTGVGPGVGIVPFERTQAGDGEEQSA